MFHTLACLNDNNESTICSYKKGQTKETTVVTFSNLPGHQRGSGKRGSGGRVLPESAGFTFDLTVLRNKMEESYLARLFVRPVLCCQLLRYGNYLFTPLTNLINHYLSYSVVILVAVIIERLYIFLSAKLL